MAVFLLLSSCCYLLDHPDHGGGNGAGVMLHTHHLLALSVAAKGASPVYEQHRVGWATLCPWLETLWRVVQEHLPPVVQEKWNIPKDIKKTGKKVPALWEMRGSSIWQSPAENKK